MKHSQLLCSAATSAALFLAGLSLPARAQDPDDMNRGVGRISLMNGQVSVQRGDSGEWVAGVVNAPLIAGDRVATAENSRAEVQFDSSNLFRMGANAEVHLTQLEAARYQLEFAKGILTFRVLRPTDASVEVDTPSVSVRPSRVGTYRISVNEAGETHVTARSGSVEVFSPRGSQTVSSGQTLIARGDPADPEYQIVAAVGYDEWDRWNDSRDRALMQSSSPQYVGPGVSGTEDLDGYGTWTNVDGYGEVWRPTVAPDWAPYQYGRWVWLDWYGWTWVSSDPWGGRAYYGGLNRSVSFTNVNIAAVYRNARVANGVSSVAAEDFRNGRFGNVSHPGGEQLRSAGLIHGQVGIAPSRTNLQYAARLAAFAPRGSSSTRFFTHRQPAAIARVPFAQQQRAMEQGSLPSGAAVAGRPGGAANDRPAMAGGAASLNRPNGAAATGGANATNSGFRRFGDPGPQSSGAAGVNAAQRPAMQNTRPAVQPSIPATSIGYRRFGSPGNSPQSSSPQYGSPQSRPSQPTYSAPQRSPAPSSSAPARSSGGGSSGGSRSSGGGAHHR